MPGVMIGQNVACGNQDVVTAVNMWAGEISDFNYGADPSGVVRHYTQVRV